MAPATPRGPRGKLAAAVALLCLVSIAPAAATDSLARARVIAGALSADAPAEAYARAARDFGEVVDEARRARGEQQAVLALRELATDLKGRTLARLRSAEAATGGGEAALEQLYRSRDWEDLGFALSAFPFWSAWLDFTLGERQAGSPRRAGLLGQAKRGFRAASMQIFQPSLVFGGWLGLAMVARAEGDVERARTILAALDEALSGVPDHPLRGVVKQELAIVGAVAPPGTGDGARHAATRRQMLALLEPAAASADAAAKAATLFRRIVAEGGMDAQLWRDLQRLRAALAGQDLAGYERLLDAERAYEDARWADAFEGYRRFLADAKSIAGVDVRPYRYRQAVAGLQAGRAADAVRGAEQLLADRTLDSGMRRALVKLVYVARARSTAPGAAARERATLLAAAQRFVDSAPNDPDADGARLLIAQATPDTRRALALLDRVDQGGRVAGQVDAARFHLLARELARRGAEPVAALAQLGRRGMQAWDALGADARNDDANLVQQLEFRAIAAADPRAELATIRATAARLGARFQPSLLQARLRCHERLQDATLAAEDLATPATSSGRALETLLPWLQLRAGPALRDAVGARLSPLLASQPAAQRRVLALRVDAMLLLGKPAEAYGLARKFVEDHPASGEAYRALARAASAHDRPYEADDAWRVITDRTPPDRPAWWEGMLARVELRLASTRPEAACALLAEAAERGASAPAAQRERWDGLRARAACTERPAN